MLGLIHGDHVASIEDAEEMEVAELAHISGIRAVDGPLLVVGGVEVLLAAPLSLSGPGLTTAPVADPILVTGVDEDLNLGLVEDLSNLRHKVGHPVSEEVGVNELVALNPLAVRDTKGGLDVSTVKENIRLAEIVTERRLGARLTDVIHVELGVERVAKDGLREDLAELEGSKTTFLGGVVLRLVDKALAGLHAADHDIFPRFGDEAVLVGEGSVRGVLGEWVGETVADGHTLKVQVHIGGGEGEVVGNGGDVMAGVRLTSDVEVTASELGVLLNEATEHDGHILGDLSLGLGIMEATLGEAGADGLIDVEQVGDLVPGVFVALEGRVLVELVGTVLVEESDLRGAAGAASEPQDERVGGGGTAGVEQPVEHIILVVVNGDEAGRPFLGITEDSGGVVGVGVGARNGSDSEEGKCLGKHLICFIYYKPHQRIGINYIHHIYYL